MKFSFARKVKIFRSIPTFFANKNLKKNIKIKNLFDKIIEKCSNNIKKNFNCLRKKIKLKNT